MISRVKRVGIPACLATLLLFSVGCGTTPESSAEGPGRTEAGQPPVITVVRPQPADGDQAITLPGTFEPYERALLRAQVTGYIERIHVDIGDEVEEGEILAEITVPELRSDLERDEAVFHRAEVAAELARISYERISSLRSREPGAVSQQDVDLASAELEMARADVEVAGAALAALRDLAKYAMIRSPFRGGIVRRSADRGTLVKAGETDGEAIFEVARTDRLRLAFEIPETFAPFVGRGTDVSVTIDVFPNEEFQLPIARTAKALDRQTRSMRVEADWANEEVVVRPGMYARIRLSCRSIPGVVSVPSGALRSIDGSPTLLVVESERLISVPVTVLFDNGVRAAVRGPIERDARVVETASPSLRPGDEVEPRLNGETS